MHSIRSFFCLLCLLFSGGVLATPPETPVTEPVEVIFQNNNFNKPNINVQVHNTRKDCRDCTMYFGETLRDCLASLSVEDLRKNLLDLNPCARETVAENSTDAAAQKMVNKLGPEGLASLQKADPAFVKTLLDKKKQLEDRLEARNKKEPEKESISIASELGRYGLLALFVIIFI